MPFNNLSVEMLTNVVEMSFENLLFLGVDLQEIKNQPQGRS